mgnify:CR=1 FL=1
MHVRSDLIAGSFDGIGPFASRVRDVFAACYQQHGHPDRSALSKKCERLDSVFEQNVTLFFRHRLAAATAGHDVALCLLSRRQAEIV